MVKLRVRTGVKGQIVIPGVIRDKLGISPGEVLLIDEEDGEIVIEKCDVDEFVEWLGETRKRIAKDVYRMSLEDEFE